MTNWLRYIQQFFGTKTDPFWYTKMETDPSSSLPSSSSSSSKLLLFNYYNYSYVSKAGFNQRGTSIQVYLYNVVTYGIWLQWGGRLGGQAVACWTADHYHPCSNLGVGISESCFIFDFTSLPLEVARPIWPTVCTKVAIKHQRLRYI